MTDLAAFVRARLDEDEAAAKAAASRPLGPAWDDGTRLTVVAAHINRHDPARVLREVAAKRAILAECEEWMLEHAPSGAQRTLRALAAVYSDHPDYDPAWAAAS